MVVRRKSSFKTKAPQCYQVGRVSRYTSLDQGDGYIEGVVRTEHGFVKVYSQEEHSSYEFIWQGRAHHLYEDVERSRRGLTLVANRFAKAIVNGERL